MNVLVYLIPAALALGLLALYGLFWSLKREQYDDLEVGRSGSARRRHRDEMTALDPSARPAEAPGEAAAQSARAGRMACFCPPGAPSPGAVVDQGG